MVNRLEAEARYIYNQVLQDDTPADLREEFRNSDILNRQSWLDESAVLKLTFYDSSGRQYGQAHPEAVHAADVQERNVPVDWDVMHSDEPFKIMKYWKLPGSHSQKPFHTDGLVPASLSFWWDMLRDTMKWRFDPSYELPSRQEIEQRFEKYGAKLLETSSTSEEELAGLDASVSLLRDNPAMRTASSDELAAGDRDAQLKVGLHWQAHTRPRRDHGDPHEVVMRTGILNMLQKSPKDFKPYDHVYEKYYNAFERLATASPDELAADPKLAKTHWLHGRFITRYNKEHKPEENIAFFHRPTQYNIEEWQASGRLAPDALGAALVASQVEVA